MIYVLKKRMSTRVWEETGREEDDESQITDMSFIN